MIREQRHVTREQHSADWKSYIENHGPGTLWVVVIEGRECGSFKTREEARHYIRVAKVAGLMPSLPLKGRWKFLANGWLDD